MHKYRTHNCAQLNKSHIGQKVKLSGFVHSKRDHGGLVFIDLRDHFGITQLVINSQDSVLNLDEITAIKLESVIVAQGEVVARAIEVINSNIATGEIEV
ncbi:MAG TPA: OB-fold nucleic acid binding domain-containing protein, partial [Rickettsiales bacterium]|nr:OB-fold nucleic acid binding domain-containing protein [Rickettsiales bacterium]